MTDVEEVCDAVQKFSDSAQKLCNVWSDWKDDGSLDENYPFDKSFDELMCEIDNWAWHLKQKVITNETTEYE